MPNQSPSLFQRWKATLLAIPVLSAAYVGLAMLAPNIMNNSLHFITAYVGVTALIGFALAQWMRFSGFYERDRAGHFRSGIEGTGGGAAQFAYLLLIFLLARRGVSPDWLTEFIGFVLTGLTSIAVFHMVAGPIIPQPKEVTR